MQIVYLIAACFLALSSVQAHGYIAFYSDPNCRNQVGSKHYSLDNTGCFANGGSYMQVVASEDGADGPYKFMLTQTKQANCQGGTLNAIDFNDDVRKCQNLGGAGYITGGNGADHPYSIRVHKA